MPADDDEPTRPELIDLVRETMAFLDDRTTRAVTVKDEAWSTVVAFVAGPLTFEVWIDWRERDASLLVGRTVNGRRPPGYYMHEGRRVRIHLGEVIEDFGSETDRLALPELRRLAGRNGYAAISDQVLSFATTLRPMVDNLLDHAHEIFPD